MGNPMLEARIKEFDIPRWPYAACFDRVIVWTLPEAKAKRDTYIPGGHIHMPERVKQAIEDESPRGVLVSAGLTGRDYLASHGMGLGHVVWVARLSPWRHEVERDSQGRDIRFLFLRAGDLCGSEDTLKWEAEGRIQVVTDAEGKHHYVFDGETRPRFDPPSFVG